jgi:FKBP-type peptidyl-prolyl cis-trans isomerase SlyD
MKETPMTENGDTNLSEQIRKDTLVVLEYSVRLADGEYLKGEGSPASLNFVVGYDQVLPGLEKRLIGLGVGTDTEFVIPAGEAFGEYDESMVHTRPFSEFPEGKELQAGKWVLATNKETQAQYSYFVKEKTREAAVLDFNHPLAGKELRYHVKIALVRPALREELEFLRPCEHGEEEETNT